VITHRIELGSFERDRLEGLIAATTFNKVTTPIVAGMSDVSFMIALAGILVIWFPDIIIPSGAPTPNEVVDAIKTGIDTSIEKGKAAAKSKVQAAGEWVETGAETVIGLGSEERGEGFTETLARFWKRIGVDWRYVR
jgi:hypothetical protein